MDRDNANAHLGQVAGRVHVPQPAYRFQCDSNVPDERMTNNPRRNDIAWIDGENGRVLSQFNGRNWEAKPELQVVLM